MNRKIGLVFSYGVMITEIVSAMFVTPFIIRSLGQAEYGIYQLTSSITAYLIIFDLGVGNSVIRYMAKFRATGRHNVSSWALPPFIMRRLHLLYLLSVCF